MNRTHEAAAALSARAAAALDDTICLRHVLAAALTTNMSSSTRGGHGTAGMRHRHPRRNRLQQGKLVSLISRVSARLQCRKVGNWRQRHGR